MLRSRFVALACLLAVPSFVACVNDTAADETGESEDALRALSSSEIIGEIPFGTAVSASHSGTPKYRAYWFEAQAGDKVDIWVRSTNADAHAWLLDDGFRTLKWNNDANATNEAEDDATTTDSNITYTASHTGKYYVAFRGAIGVAATFSVEVDRTSTQGPPIDPPQAGNPWSCSGAPLSNAELIARIPTGGDSLSLLPSGGLHYETRSRTCNQQTGCAAWSEPTSVSGKDGTLATLSLKTSSSGAVSLTVASESDSNHTYRIDDGAVAGTSHHAPNHTNGPYEATLTSTCFGSRIKTTQGTNGQGTWTEIEYGVRTSMPAAINRPVEDDANPWDCGAATLSQSEILRRFPAGSDTLALATSSSRYETRTRSCSSLTGCAPWTALSPVSGKDGAIATLTIQTTSANGLRLHVASESDSNHTYDVSSGSFSGSSHHAPNHTNGPVAGGITNGCIGYRIQTKTNQSGTGTWTETDYGYKAGFPAPVR